MNRRATVITLLILLLILLLVAQALTSPPKIVRKAPPTESTASPQSTAGLLDDPSGLPTVEAVSATEQQKPIVEMVNHSGMVNPSGYYEVFGQVQNIGSVTARQVRVYITFRDSEFVEVAKLETPVYKPTLGPGERSDFKVTLPDAGISRTVGSYVALVLITR